MDITTPCVVCATHARLKSSPFFATRGLSWPTTEVAGHQVHKCCASEVEHLVTVATDGTLAVSPEGVGTWTTNGSALMEDTAALIAALGLAPALDPDATRVARDKEAAAFLASYRANPPQPDAEQLAEMRAAFGPDATVVDVITGQQIRL